MKILITGGGGFIGSAFLRVLPAGIKVVSIDHGKNYPYLKRSLAHNVHLLRGNIGDDRLLRKAARGIYAIYHLGGISGERLCLASPRSALESNILATRNLIKAAVKGGVKKFIFASSYWVYPTFRRSAFAFKEADRPDSTDSFYGNLKICAEELVRDSSLDYAVLRFSNVYGFGSGVGSQWRGLVGNYILNVFEGNPIIIYGDGSQKIDLVHIDDVTMTMTYFLDRSPQKEIFNVASGKLVSVADIVSCIKRVAMGLCGVKVKVKKIDPSDNKVWPDKAISINKLKRYTGITPQVELEDGILDFMQKIYEVKKNDHTLYKALLQQKRY